MEPSKANVSYRVSCTNCCVVGCHNNYSNTDKSVKFYSFPSKPHELERRTQWISAVNRSKSHDCRELWEPKAHSRICSQHFTGNAKSNHPHNPAFLPTIFPEVYKKNMINSDGNASFDSHIVIKNLTTTVPNSQIPETSTDMKIPIVIKNEPDEQSNQQIQEHRLERRKRLARERSKKNRDTIKNELNEQSNQQIQQIKLERERKLARERCKRYRARKRLSSINIFEDMQIPAPSSGNPPPVIKNRKTVDNSQIPRTSTDVNIPIVTNDYSGKNESNEQSNEPIEQDKLERQRKLARECSKRYRARKRLSSLTSIKKFVDAILDTQIPGLSSGNPQPVIKNRETTTDNSQIPGTSADMNIPIVTYDYSVKNEPNEQSNQQIQEHKLERRRRLARERSKRNRDRKKNERNEQSNQQIQENRLERRRRLARERSKRNRDRKKNERNEQSSQQILQDKLERRRKLAQERCKRYRARKRLSSINIFEDAIRNMQIPGPSSGSPPPVIKNRKTTDNSQIPRTSTDVNIPIVTNDYSGKNEPNEQIQQDKLERQRTLARERCKRYRARKRLSDITSTKKFEDDTQIAEPSNGNPPLVIKNRGITINSIVTHRIFLLYSWLQKKTETKLTHFYNFFIV